jgi:hypothetical protein
MFAALEAAADHILADSFLQHPGLSAMNLNPIPKIP